MDICVYGPRSGEQIDDTHSMGQTMSDSVAIIPRTTRKVRNNALNAESKPFAYLLARTRSQYCFLCSFVKTIEHVETESSIATYIVDASCKQDLLFVALDSVRL